MVQPIMISMSDILLLAGAIVTISAAVKVVCEAIERIRKPCRITETMPIYPIWVQTVYFTLVTPERMRLKRTMTVLAASRTLPTEHVIERSKNEIRKTALSVGC